MEVGNDFELIWPLEARLALRGETLNYKIAQNGCHR